MNNIVHEVVNENDMDVMVEKVEDIVEILKYDVMNTPALVVEDTIVLSGRIPSADELLKILATQGIFPNSLKKKDCC
jgi:hypothetical protein